MVIFNRVYIIKFYEEVTGLEVIASVRGRFDAHGAITHFNNICKNYTLTDIKRIK